MGGVDGERCSRLEVLWLHWSEILLFLVVPRLGRPRPSSLIDTPPKDSLESHFTL